MAKAQAAAGVSISGTWAATNVLNTNKWGTPADLLAGGDPLCSMWNDDTDITSCSTSKDSSGIVGTGSAGAAAASQACCLLTFAASFGAGATARSNLVSTNTKLCYGRGNAVKPGSVAAIYYGDTLCLMGE